MKAICKVIVVLTVLVGILTVCAALIVSEQKPDYIRIYGDPEETQE